MGDAKYLGQFDVLLLYANHGTIQPHQWKNLKNYVENGGGFVPVHCASWCFGNEPGFDQLVGGRFQSHQGAVFSARITDGKHPAMKGVQAFEAWDETYFHTKHNPKNRTVLMVRDAMPGDPHTKPEPWTWVRTQGKGRVFYTASGHDARVWGHAGFHQLLKSGILWAAGESVQARYKKFLAGRAPLKYEKRDNVPNYEKRPEPLPYQLPLSAAESMKYTQVPAGWELQLFAAEPQIVNPIYMQWDERGRLWVAESIDYPNEIKEGRKGNDRIKILEDTNGDGKCDSVKIFADGLNIPTSFTFARGGIIVAHAPEFLFFKDTDGDDKADVRARCCSPVLARATHTPARATCGTGSTTGSTARSGTPPSTARWAASNIASAWAYFASAPTARLWSFYISSTTTHGVWASMNLATCSAPRPIIIPLSSAVCPPPCTAANAARVPK